jgi:hypothetical protein
VQDEMGWESNTHQEDEKYGMGFYSGKREETTWKM